MTTPPSAILLSIAQKSEFAGRVGQLALNSAMAVATEDVATPDHVARLRFAASVLRGQYSNVLLAQIVLRDPSSSIAAAAIADQQNNADAVADADISTQINSLITAIGTLL